MKLEDARRHTIQLMEDHGLTQQGWTFGWMNAKRTLGRCYYGRLLIVLSRPFVEMNDLPTVEQTILHEIAHALAGYNAGHGIEWQNVARSIGVKNPAAKCGPGEVVMPEGRYKATCSTCQGVWHRHRMTKKMLRGEFACSRCCRKFNGGKWSEQFVLHYVDTHQAAPESTLVAAQGSTVVETPEDAPRASESVSDGPVSVADIARELQMDPKSFRAWLRRSGVGEHYRNGKKYEFTRDAADIIINHFRTR